MNMVALIGRLGADPKMRYLSDGTAVCSIDIAVRRNSDTSDWFRVDMFGKTAELVNEYMKKGSMIGVEGHLRQDKWEDDNGNRRSRVVVRARRVHFVGRSGSSGDAKPKGATSKDKDEVVVDNAKFPF